jgi:hypothetical protein
MFKRDAAGKVPAVIFEVKFIGGGDLLKSIFYYIRIN